MLRPRVEGIIRLTETKAFLKEALAKSPVLMLCAQASGADEIVIAKRKMTWNRGVPLPKDQKLIDQFFGFLEIQVGRFMREVAAT